MIRLHKNGIRWELASGFENTLDAVLAAKVEVVRESPVKLVTACASGGQTFYVKRYLHSAVRFRGLKFLFKSSQAHQEWNIARQLESLGIPIVRHVALGERWGRGGLAESILITEGFPGQPLDTAATRDPEAILEFVREMHDHGVLQGDLHAGNLLVSPHGELRLVDLHGIVVKPVLSEAERDRNLATLNLSVALPVSPEIRALTERLRRELFARRSKRCLWHNRDFAPRELGGLRWQVRLRLITPVAETVLNDPDAWLAGRAKIFKAGRSSTVGASDGLVLKRYNFRKFGNPAKDLFRASRARRAFRKAYHLELAGVLTARPVAAADRRVLGLPVSSYFLMEEIPDAVDLRYWQGDPHHAVREAAALLARLHNSGLRHRDLKETNILFDRQQRAHLIDLEGLEYVGVVPAARAQFDLSRLLRALETLPQFGADDRAELARHYEQLRQPG